MNQQSIVMIVDDDDSLRRAARRLIRSYGYAVDTFGSAEDFLASGQLDETACLVLDVRMPGLSGLGLQDRLKAMGYGFPIIFITATTDNNTRAQALTAGAFGYLIKPFDEDELLTCIKDALQPQVKRPDQQPP